MFSTISQNTLNRLTSVSTKFLSTNQTYNLSHTYDAVGNRKTVTYPDNKVTEFWYDELNRLDYLTDEDAGTLSFDYYKTGTRKKITFPNGIETSYTYNENNWVENVDSNLSGMPYFHYGYNLAGMKTGLRDKSFPYPWEEMIISNLLDNQPRIR